MRLEQDWPADGPLANQALDGQEVAVPAAVLEDAQQAAAPLGGRDDPARFRRAQGEWLVEHDIAARLEAVDRQRFVRRRRRADDDEPDALNEEWNLIFKNSLPGTKVLFRSASSNADFIPESARKLLRFRPDLTEPLHKHDRVGTYGSLHLAEVL